MVEACRKCQVASVTQRFAERHKFGEAALAYVLNDRPSNWVAQAILSRPYIVDPIIESYVTVWGELLKQSLQQACVRICKGETVRSLLATVQHNQQWLLNGYIRSVLWREIFAWPRGHREAPLE